MRLLNLLENLGYFDSMKIDDSCLVTRKLIDGTKQYLNIRPYFEIEDEGERDAWIMKHSDWMVSLVYSLKFNRYWKVIEVQLRSCQ